MGSGGWNPNWEVGRARMTASMPAISDQKSHGQYPTGRLPHRSSIARRRWCVFGRRDGIGPALNQAMDRLFKSRMMRLREVHRVKTKELTASLAEKRAPIPLWPDFLRAERQTHAERIAAISRQADQDLSRRGHHGFVPFKGLGTAEAAIAAVFDSSEEPAAIPVDRGQPVPIDAAHRKLDRKPDGGAGVRRIGRSSAFMRQPIEEDFPPLKSRIAGSGQRHEQPDELPVAAEPSMSMPDRRVADHLLTKAHGGAGQKQIDAAHLAKAGHQVPTTAAALPSVGPHDGTADPAGSAFLATSGGDRSVVEQGHAPLSMMAAGRLAPDTLRPSPVRPFVPGGAAMKAKPETSPVPEQVTPPPRGQQVDDKPVIARKRPLSRFVAPEPVPVEVTSPLMRRHSPLQPQDALVAEQHPAPAIPTADDVAVGSKDKDNAKRRHARRNAIAERDGGGGTGL